jgi:hypothetical protein
MEILSQILLGVSEQIHEEPVRIAGISAEIQTEDLQAISPEFYL